MCTQPSGDAATFAEKVDNMERKAVLISSAHFATKKGNSPFLSLSNGPVPSAKHLASALIRPKATAQLQVQTTADQFTKCGQMRSNAEKYEKCEL